jgi:hypothetical protein
MKKMLAVVTICMILLTACTSSEPYPLFENVTLTDMTLTDVHAVYRGIPRMTVEKDKVSRTFAVSERICSSLIKFVAMSKINPSIESKIDIVVQGGWVVSASLSKARN